MIDLANLPPELSEPPTDARGNYAFQPSTWRIWQRVDGVWLRIGDAQERIDARNAE